MRERYIHASALPRVFQVSETDLAPVPYQTPHGALSVIFSRVHQIAAHASSLTERKGISRGHPRLAVIFQLGDLTPGPMYADFASWTTILGSTVGLARHAIDQISEGRDR